MSLPVVLRPEASRGEDCLECGDLSPLWRDGRCNVLARYIMERRMVQSGDKSPHSKTVPPKLLALSRIGTLTPWFSFLLNLLFQRAVAYLHWR